MNVAVCIDDNMGMLFNSRRQSRDRELIKNFVSLAGKNKIFINPYSQILFEEFDVTSDENMLDTATENDFCFVEKENILPYSSKINKLIIYKGICRAKQTTAPTAVQRWTEGMRNESVFRRILFRVAMA